MRIRKAVAILWLLPTSLVIFGAFNFIFKHKVSLSESVNNSYDVQQRRLNKIMKTAVVDLQRLETVFDNLNLNECPRWFALAIELKRCFAHKISTSNDLWNTVTDISERCGADYLKNLLHAKYLINYDDVKAIIPPQDDQAKAISLTIGIGNDLSAERRLQYAYPNTKFFGADPILEDGNVFKEIGNYLNVGVSRGGGKFNASVLINGNYEWQEITTVTMPKLIQMFRLKNIDYLFLDVEGAEYDLLPDLILKKGLKISICQINVEVHGPLQKYKVTPLHFTKILRALISMNSPYVPLWIPKPTSHQRFLLIDWQSPSCIQQFFSHWC